MVNDLRVVVVGATQSTLRTLSGLYRHGLNIVGVLSLDPSKGERVSGFSTFAIELFCRHRQLPFQTFVDINEPETVDAIAKCAPDLLFAVGFSQLVGDHILKIPSKAAIGFHPTLLPRDRGRAPTAWVTADAANSAATFFVMKKGVDDGPILVQEPFEVNRDDHASDVATSTLGALDRALDRWIPGLDRGEWREFPQDETLASYNGVRRPEDGLIDWNEPADITYAKIRAASRPHPGAYTYSGNQKVTIWRARTATDMKWRGVPGRILKISHNGSILVQAGDAPLWLTEVQDSLRPHDTIQLKVGQRLGYAAEDEIYCLRQELAALRKLVNKQNSREPS